MDCEDEEGVSVEMEGMPAIVYVIENDIYPGSSPYEWNEGLPPTCGRECK